MYPTLFRQQRRTYDEKPARCITDRAEYASTTHTFDLLSTSVERSRSVTPRTAQGQSQKAGDLGSEQLDDLQPVFVQVQTLKPRDVFVSTTVSDVIVAASYWVLYCNS